MKEINQDVLRKHWRKKIILNIHCGQNHPLSSTTASLTSNYAVTRDKKKVSSAPTLEKGRSSCEVKRGEAGV